MKIIARIFSVIYIGTTLFLIFSCNNNRSSTTLSSRPTDTVNTGSVEIPVDGPAIAIVTAPAYMVKIHKAISFVPQNPSAEVIKPKPGNRFIVLNMSVKNTSDKEVDMGQILLLAKITDDQGKIVPLEPLILAAWSMEHPDPVHQLQYESIWNMLPAGSFFRTEAYAIEAPLASRQFTITLKEDALDGKSPEHSIGFSAE